MSNPKSFDLKDYMTLSDFNGSAEDCENSVLHNHFKNHTNYGTIKWEQYLPIYNKLLAPFILQGNPINLMEIGILNGGSLEIWQKFLPEGSHITGVDISADCKKMQYNEYIEVCIGDISKGELINHELKDKTFDVIVDDASHFCCNVLDNFNNTFDKLNLGGLYIIEDCHASYWKEWGGGLHGQDSTIEHFKKLVDALNYYYFKNRTILNAKDKEFYEKYHSQIASITFYDSIIVIEKYAKLKNQPFRAYSFGSHCLILSKDVILKSGHLDCQPDTKFEKIYRS